ncbi:MAG: [protein-PII] uridylyltransferase [Acidobacteria bacterium]|nr:[protein-PII] uridylyltransferase [Acidobacteriota bacterium]
MQIDLEKILIHANEKLAASGSGVEREEQVALFRRFLKIETERLRIRHRFGLSGSEVASGRSYLLDLIICHACQWAAISLAPSLDAENRWAVVALGGYGRRELAPFSDVDLLFLHAGRRMEGVREFVEPVLYLLWDIGLTVGHSVRSVRDCVAMAKEDLHSRNAMAEARLVTGNVHLFRRLTKELEESVFQSKRETDAFLRVMKLELEARYDKFGRAVCVQEPNVKESAGGLRDLHTVLWVGHARYGCKSLDDLRLANHISGTEYASARRAYDFIARVRNEAHFSTGRKTDLLTLDLQPALASSLGYRLKGGLLASEIFMYDYYQRAHELHRFCESFLVRAIGSCVGERRFSFCSKRVGASEAFEIRQGKLYQKEDLSGFTRNPIRLMEAFSLAQSECVDLSDELKQTVPSSLWLVDRKFRALPEAGRAFVEILQRRGRVAGALRLMHETEFLGRFLPEFGRITFLVQHDLYHKYTIDEHTLKALEALDQVAGGRDPKLARLGRVFAEIEDAAPLYLGLFLHDIGKGYGGGHVLRGVRVAERVCNRLGLSEQTTQDVSFLVQHHLLMSHLSQRRDLTEESLIEELATTIGSLQRLNMLMLLTYADISGVGPGTWNDWKGALLWELYDRTRSQLTGGKPMKWSRSRTMLLKQQINQGLALKFLPSEIERHLAMLPERYLRATEPSRIGRHLRLVKLLEGETLVADWRTIEEGHCTELTVCTYDRHGLFAAIAGTLTAHGINILSADLYTREDGVVIDTFKVCEVNSHHPIRTEQWWRVEQKLKAAIEGRYDVAAAVEQWRARAPRRAKRHRSHILTRPTIRFDSEVSATSTVIEAKADDEPGLAYRIASTLAALQLNITFAKITTEKSHALDVFYVTDSRGQKLTSTDLSLVERTLLEALASRNQKPETGTQNAETRSQRSEIEIACSAVFWFLCSGLWFLI